MVSVINAKSICSNGGVASGYAPYKTAFCYLSIVYGFNYRKTGVKTLRKCGGTQTGTREGVFYAHIGFTAQRVLRLPQAKQFMLVRQVLGL